MNIQCPTKHVQYPIRILLLADTHLGFDLPVRPRIERRRRGHDFFDNFERVLETAVTEKVDCVVHAGDLFYRSRIPADLVQKVFLPMKRVADAGIPIYIVPGNHERSRIPYDMLSLHRNIYIFDRPRTFVRDFVGASVALAGFPYFRGNVRSEFRSLLDATSWREAGGDLNLLCLHHCFEGATVGAHNHTFRYGQEVIRLQDVPREFAAVLTGHVHRAQVLREDLAGRSLHTLIAYPGAIERTAFAERDEVKGFMLVEISGVNSAAGPEVMIQFRALPSRPMVVEDLNVSALSRRQLEDELNRILHSLPRDSIVQLRARGTPPLEAREVLRAQALRSLAPSTMNVELVIVDGWRRHL